ncbi:retrotransposon protein, putative, ty1-copia subclass, partial [Tanacetum coccineum]
SLNLQIRQSKRRNHTLLDIVRQMINLTTLSLSFWDYALESAARILNMVPTKKVDKTPCDLCGREGVELEEIQDEDTSPSEITSEIPMEVEGFKPPQEELIPVHRFVWTYRAPECLCLNVEEEEHSLRDFNEPANYKAAMLDPESDKWLNAMNAKMQFMKDNQDSYRRGVLMTMRYLEYRCKSAFLNGFLVKTLLVQPNGFIDPNIQAKYASGRNVTLLILYVDDIIIMGNHIPSLQSVKAYLGKYFAMKDLGEAENLFLESKSIRKIEANYLDLSKRLHG